MRGVDDTLGESCLMECVGGSLLLPLCSSLLSPFYSLLSHTQLCLVGSTLVVVTSSSLVIVSYMQGGAMCVGEYL